MKGCPGVDEGGDTILNSIPPSALPQRYEMNKDNILTSGGGALANKIKPTEGVHSMYGCGREEERVDREMDDPEGGTIVKDGGEDANVIGGGAPPEVQGCQFRRVKCLQHTIKGEKMVTNVRKWVKKKNGLHCYSTTRLVT